MQVIEQTKVLCPQCRTTHAASLVREDNCIMGRTGCPAGPSVIPLSDDAELFLRLRRDDVPAGDPLPPLTRRFKLCQLYITDACNCRCPVCFRAAGDACDAPSHLPVLDALRRARLAKQLRFRGLCLIGGEPTLHPELPTIIRGIRQMGLKVAVVTNGLTLGRSPMMASTLKAAGAWRVNIQFDTLDEKALRQLRGHGELETKKRAVQHASAAGLGVVLTATVTADTIHTIGGLLEWASSLETLPLALVLQGMVPVGRYPAAMRAVSREAIIREILACRSIHGATIDHIHPTPVCRPLGLVAHPDCGAHLVTIRRGRKMVPADTAVALASVRRYSATLPAAMSARMACLRLAWRFVTGVRHPMDLGLLRAIASRFGGHGNRLMMIGVASFCRPGFIEMNRIDRCATCVMTALGPVSTCTHFASEHPCTSP